MSEMIKRVAAAMKAKAAEPVANLPNGLDPCLVTCLGDGWLILAKAAIEAMREPTHTMVEAAEKLTLSSGTESECWSDHHPKPTWAWEAMIDEALK